MNRVIGPIGWYGGKGNMVRKLLPLLPPHRIYVEVFGGGAALLFAKEPSPVEVYNDIDSDLVNFFRVLRDPEKFQEFYRKVCLTPYSREEYKFFRETFDETHDPVERAYRFFVIARWSFSGDFGIGWSYTVNASWRGMAGSCSKWLSAIERLPEFHERIMRVQIEHADFRQVIRTYDTPDTLFYCDPPYIPEARRSKKIYRHEMSVKDHEDLVDLLLGIQGKAILSGYRHPVYAPLEEAGWKRLDFPTACYAVARTPETGILGKGAALAKQPRVESVWLSPRCLEGRPNLPSEVL